MSWSVILPALTFDSSRVYCPCSDEERSSTSFSSRVYCPCSHEGFLAQGNKFKCVLDVGQTIYLESLQHKSVNELRKLQIVVRYEATPSSEREILTLKENPTWRERERTSKSWRYSKLHWAWSTSQASRSQRIIYALALEIRFRNCPYTKRRLSDLLQNHELSQHSKKPPSLSRPLKVFTPSMQNLAIDARYHIWKLHASSTPSQNQCSWSDRRSRNMLPTRLAGMYLKM